MNHIPSAPLYLGPDIAGRGRWVLSAALGTGLGLGAVLLSYLLPTIVFGSVQGMTYGFAGLLQATLVPLAVWVGLKPVGLTLGDVGVRGPRVGPDALLGAGVAVVFAVLQFGILIPSTGGAQRSDVVMSTAQIGGSSAGVIGLIVLAWTGGVAEELLFRGHLLHTLRNALGSSRVSLATAALITVVVFGGLHGYQGWAGVIDTGLYGGVTLTALFIATGGRLTACAVAHAGWNTLAVIGLYVWY